MIAIAAVARQPRPAVELIGAGPPRSDLRRRQEIKFTLSHPDLGALRGLLEGNGRRQVFREAVSTVRSVYFDDARLSACLANVHGLARRRKLRIRWYDSPLPQGEFYLEIKWRENRVTGKHRLALRCGSDFWTLPYKTVLAEIARTAPEAYLPALLENPEPVLIVEYRREHFVSREWPLRATLDHGIVYYDQTGKQRLSASFGRRHDGLVVLEGKVPIGHDAELRAFLHPFAARVARCSKYVHGCRMLGLIQE